MVSAISAISSGYYTALANRSAMNVMNAANARMNLLSQPAVSFGSLDAIHSIDTALDLEMISNSLTYKTSKAMAEQLEKLQKKDAKKLDFYA